MTKKQMVALDNDLPEPIALTPDQLEQITTATAGGALTFASRLYLAGGPILQALQGGFGVTSLPQQTATFG